LKHECAASCEGNARGWAWRFARQDASGMKMGAFFLPRAIWQKEVAVMELRPPR